MSESTEKIIDVKVDSEEMFMVGEEVMVAVHRKVGLWAVAVAYVAPLVVLVAVLAVASAVGLNENIAALGSLGGVAVYYLLLWAFGGRVTQKVSFTISKI
jgi:positive regulator of sigma E activity